VSPSRRNRYAPSPTQEGRTSSGREEADDCASQYDTQEDDGTSARREEADDRASQEHGTSSGSEADGRSS
jgi:hypothetical protein